ncbi:hypothetical protein Adt_40219 [Abeliophyllum distichum]|uniref:Uncharacterized protein n=1 Tax=Abeliophyllum distichum TaxID=126358 RepID=A0ABD1Q7B5_9LAMI
MRHFYAKNKAIQISMSSLPAATLSPLPKRRGSDKPVIPHHVDHPSMLYYRYVIITCNHLTLQGVSPRCLALQPGTRSNCSLAPPLPPKSIASLLGLPTWDSDKLQLGSSLTSKENRLAAWPSHLGLNQTAAWLLPSLKEASPHCLALPLGTRPNCSLAPPFPRRSIALLLGSPTWNSAKLQLGSSLTSKENRLAA